MQIPVSDKIKDLIEAYRQAVDIEYNHEAIKALLDTAVEDINPDTPPSLFYVPKFPVGQPDKRTQKLRDINPATHETLRLARNSLRISDDRNLSMSRTYLEYLCRGLELHNGNPIDVID